MNYKLLGYRRVVGLTQKEMSALIGIGSTSYSLKESGKRDFTQTEMENIIKVFRKNGKDFKMDEIFFRE